MGTKGHRFESRHLDSDLFFFFFDLIMGLNFNLIFIKMESLILAKGLSFFYKGFGLQEVSFWLALGGLFDIEMTPANILC